MYGCPLDRHLFYCVLQNAPVLDQVLLGGLIACGAAFIRVRKSFRRSAAHHTAETAGQLPPEIE